MVRYAYDDVTFRLARLCSEGYTKPDQATYSPDGPVHQDFSYTYDAAGNITELDSDSANVGVGGTDHLQRVFEYDPIYRLKKATGREYGATKTYPWDDNGGNSDDPTQTHDYTELYEYDDVGNMTKLTHQYDNNSGTWTRNFSHEGDSNQLDTMNDGGGTTRSYTYDAAGNLTQENSNRKHEWDWGGRMRSFRDQPPGSQATVFAHYTYDSGGQRTQKVVCKDNDAPVHTVYIGGIYEHHEKISSGSVTAENNFLHVMDDSRRVAIKRIGAHLDGTNPASVQYHLCDHLQSSSVVLDGAGNFFNREEYRPYGETSFGSYDKKRYRFTGQERDEESGLNYHGARYYAPWAPKWHSPDPKGMVDGPNTYNYVNSNPLKFRDPTGMQKSSDESSQDPDTSSQRRSGGSQQPRTNNTQDVDTLADIWDQLPDYTQDLLLSSGLKKEDIDNIEIQQASQERLEEWNENESRVSASYDPEQNTIYLRPSLMRTLENHPNSTLGGAFIISSNTPLSRSQQNSLMEEIAHAAVEHDKVRDWYEKHSKFHIEGELGENFGEYWEAMNSNEIYERSRSSYIDEQLHRERRAKSLVAQIRQIENSGNAANYEDLSPPEQRLVRRQARRIGSLSPQNMDPYRDWAIGRWEYHAGKYRVTDDPNSPALKPHDPSDVFEDPNDEAN